MFSKYFLAVLKKSIWWGCSRITVLCVNEFCTAKQSLGYHHDRIFLSTTDKSAVASWVKFAMSSWLFWLLFVLFFTFPVMLNTWPDSGSGSMLSRILERWGMTIGTILLTGHLPSLGKTTGTPSRRQTGKGKRAQDIHWDRAQAGMQLSIIPAEPGFFIIWKELNARKAGQKSPSLKIQWWESRLTLLTKHSFNRNV